MQVNKSNTLCQPKTKLILQVADAFIPSTGAYFFQRSAVTFDFVFQYYSTGVIHRPPEICTAQFLSELEFWRLPQKQVGSCCAEDLPREVSEEKEEEKVMSAST